MNIQTILLTSLALIGCDTGKIGPDDTNTPPTGGGNCGGEYPFEIEESIYAGRLERLLDGSDDLATVTCEELCRDYYYEMVEMDTCDYSFDFETLPIILSVAGL